MLSGDVQIAASRNMALMTRIGATVSIGAQALRRRVLVDAVALAAGRGNSDATRDAGQSDASAARTAAAEGVTLLVAEDDEINRRVISRQLALLGYAADMAVDGQEALEMWRTKPYTLVLTDLHMPRRDGYELAQAIRSEEVQLARTRAPIVALTANAINGEANRAKALGIDDYLTKPLKLNLLEQALAQWTASARNGEQPDAPANAAPAAQRASEPSTRSSLAATASADSDTALQEPMPETPRTSTTSNEPATIVDVNVLKGIVGDDHETVQALLIEYIECSAELAEQLQAHLAEDRAREAAAVAHKLKSSSRSIGALPLGELCAEIETTASKGELGSFGQLGARFGLSYRQAIEAARHIALTIDIKPPL